MMAPGLSIREDLEALKMLKKYDDDCSFKTFTIMPWKGVLKGYEVNNLLLNNFLNFSDKTSHFLFLGSASKYRF